MTLRSLRWAVMMKLPLPLLRPRLTKVCSEWGTYTFNYSPVWARGHWRQRYKQATQGTELEWQITLKPGPCTSNTHAWSLSTQPPASLSKDGNKWPSVDGIPAWTWTSPPRKKVWCCLPQSSSPAKRVDSGHSGNPKHSTWGKRSNRESLKTLSLTLPKRY